MKHLATTLLASLTFMLLGVLVAHAQSYTPLAPLPIGEGGATPDTYTLPTYLAGMIKLIIALAGAIAILTAIVGGVQFVASGITPDAKNNAKTRIENAFVGLALVLTSYLILNSISPDLVNMKFLLPPITTQTQQQLAGVTAQAGRGTSATTGGATTTVPQTGGATTTPGVAAPTPGGLCPTPNDSSAACCPKGVKCKACSNCSVVTGVPNKGCDLGVCYLNTTLLTKIQSVGGVSGWQVTESWPPTVDHLSRCHQDGTCADLNNSRGKTDAVTIKKYYDAFKKAGLNVLYESKDCSSYISAGVTNCKSYPSMTNLSSFHVK